MKVDLEKTFPLPGSAEVAWEFLQRIETVAECMPGARVNERTPEGRYKGTVTVKAGPATMAFRGELEVRDVDPAARSLRLIGKGTDSTGTSGASMDLSARIETTGTETSNLVGRSAVTMSGKAAAFGGRMMTSVADQILKQFAERFAGNVSELALQRKKEAAIASRSGAVSLAASEPPALPASHPAGTAVAATTSAALSAAAKPSGRGPEAASASREAVANELNGLALAWAVLKDWLRSLFKRPA